MTMIAVDVQYDDDAGHAAAVVFDDWSAAGPLRSCVSRISPVGEYVPGEFYKRELPCILRLLDEHALTPDCIVIDGYVYLDGHARPGLGKYLHDALGGKVSVIGVAKTAFAEIGPAFALCRGQSQKPLYVTCIGEDLAVAKAHVLAMHGEHRIPSLLRQVDQLSRLRD